MTSGHAHHSPLSNVSASARHQWRLVLALALVGGFVVVEIGVAVATGSLVLLSDAGHMLTDTVGLGLALLAIRLGLNARGDPQRTFGLHRAEILAALVNAVLLIGIAGYVVIEAVRRFAEPPDLDPAPLVAVGTLGVVVAVACAVLLRPGAQESLNLRGAYLEVLADAVGSLGVVAAAVVLWTTGWPYADPLFALGVGAFVLPRALRLGRDALRVLVQAAPPHVPVERLREDLTSLDDVLETHDLHVWTLTSGMEVVTAHLVVRDGCAPGDILDEARALLAERYGIEHATLQLEEQSGAGCEPLAW